MKKKTITTLAALIATVIVTTGTLINENDGTALSGILQTEIFNKSADISGQNLEKTEFPETILKAVEEGIAPFGYIEAVVTEVVDGDTFHIEYKSREHKVRLLDIDTPESVKSGVKPQPYSAEASEITKKMLTGKKVKLIFEKEEYDQFGRLLAHVILEDGTYYNALMVQNGFAICVFYSPNTLLKQYFTGLQDTALKKGKGFWQLPEKDRPFIKDAKGKYIASYKLKKKAA